MVVGTIVGRTVDLIPDKWWVSILALLVVAPLLLILKDRVTDWLYAKRDKEIKRKSLTAGTASWLAVRTKWYSIDFMVGTLILIPGILLSQSLFVWIFRK